ncbi:acyl carrier protein [Alteromonas ponticola]|uniref:Acyl carrier protein n=1 Tax=Alteromonas aquimaris TaxID=2998417 RepID=A0ABT3P5B5_9ALTE|nr:hypothetical protein [Alteromonas aquimaris]MCW8107958.1 acyl carrier protein [Alteromonas aquimaris]
MNKQQLIETIEIWLEKQSNVAKDNIHTSSKLISDLKLDDEQLKKLFVHLEKQLDVEIPEMAVQTIADANIGQFAEYLLNRRR